jgi:DNA-binding NtrC family response regulator
MTMPAMTGELLAREMMSIRPDIPVILCTGFSEALNDKKIAESPVKALVMKPLLIDEIDRAIRRVLKPENPPRRTSA